MRSKVIILGGGIAGLSAAHELIERGFAVEVYEMQSIPGGKARSVGVPGSGTQGRPDLPGEHGFRFFPRFYRHVVDTMSRIPFGQGHSVADNLVDTTRVQLCHFGRSPFLIPARFVRTLGDMRLVLDDLRRVLGGDLDVSNDEYAYFSSRVWQVLTSCRERRLAEYEKISWWDFIGASTRSQAYQRLFGHVITRSLVAAKAESANTKTIGDIFVQLLFDIVTPGPSTDRVLNGPTNEVWIEPWLDHLRNAGVRYELNTKVIKVHCEYGAICGVDINSPHGTRTLTGDYYIFALPVGDMVKLLSSEILRADPALGKLPSLEQCTEWMNGVQIYLNEDVQLAHGHTIYADSPWALTSISQAQFWNDIDVTKYGDGTVRGIISVDISEWDQPGLCGKTAKDCTPEEIKAEVWEQLKRSHNHGNQTVLRDSQVHSWFLDPSLTRHHGAPFVNEEPLLVNLVNTWGLRPDAVTRIPNMFLASDYVRTYTDLATMESANEAARRAVNGLLDAAQSTRPRCALWPLHELEVLAPWRELDRIRFEEGLPWDPTLVDIGLSVVDLLNATLDNRHGGSVRTASQDNRDPKQAGVEAYANRRNGLLGQDISALRQEGAALVEQFMYLIGLQLAQGVLAPPAGKSTTPSQVRIIPR